MGERLVGDYSDRLAQDRLLTEVDHLSEHRHGGLYDAAVLDDVRINLGAAVQEMAMPFAVTTTFQRAEETVDEAGRRQRQFRWLGRCAVEVAASGRDYHFSRAALDRVDVEMAEARHSQETLGTGRAQIFISPRMSEFDAPRDVAEREHLADEDAVRVSTLVTDSQGRALGRRMESLLVRDVPLDAWMAMLRDPHNIFGRAFAVRDDQSALSVMELFDGFELAESDVAHGPVEIVEAVLPYITDERARSSVERQIIRFREDQARYAERADRTAHEWLAFEMVLADSLAAGHATTPVEAFIASLQHQWGAEDLAVMRDHQLPGGGYRMTRRLAAVLERGQRHVLVSLAAIAVGNESVVGQIGSEAAAELLAHEAHIEQLEATGAPATLIALERATLQRHVAGHDIAVGGGCAGVSEQVFQSSRGFGQETDEAEAGLQGAARRGGKESWQWKPGTCRVRNCQSPSPTEVGPCNVCRRCQGLYDAGLDPSKAFSDDAVLARRARVQQAMRYLRRSGSPGTRRSAAAVAA